MGAANPSPIVSFHRGSGRDARGRTLDEILAWDDERLEAVHDYIQWLFPLMEPSRFNPYAPLLTPADRAAFHEDAGLAANLRRAFERMLTFYGFVLDRSEVGVRVSRSAAWTERSAEWLHPGNHNLLRLTRILKSLMLLGQPELAHALHVALHSAAKGRIAGETLVFWENAVQE